MLKLHNTASRQIEQFSPIKDDYVSLYTCGPTVYDFAHLGNLRSFVFDDTLRRTLECFGYKVKHVMNITDVGHLVSDADEGEDKLERGAKRENKSVWDVAEFYIKAFESDVKALNILLPNGYLGSNGSYARATDFIDEQSSIIKQLLDKGFAYKTKQAIYFDVNKLDDYGKLTGQKLADKEVGARSEVVVDHDKHHPQDFALWFFKVGRFAGHSMAWDSPWGEGFPGWHLECSAIIHAILGEPIDIHTGGVDHIGTHHTNEIAQTEAAFGVKLSNYWLHNEHLLVESQKMSKSLGNFYTLQDVKDKEYDPIALRLLFLQSHYRSQSNFTWESLKAAQNLLGRVRAFADLRFQHDLTPNPLVLGGDYFENAKKDILQAMADDLATPSALAKLNEVMEHITSKVGGINHTSQAQQFNDFLEFLDKIFGLDLLSSKDISQEQKKIIKAREEARTTQNWQTADKLREQLAKQGLEIEDTTYGPTWRRS